MRELLVGVKPFMNPMPPKNPGGDCFACSLKATVDHLYPGNPVPFETAWNAFMVPRHRGPQGVSEEKVLSNVWHTMAWGAPHELAEDGYKLEVHHDIVLPQVDLRMYSHAWGLKVHGNAFGTRLEAWLSAGWIAIVELSMNGAEGDGRQWTDHFAVLDGQRSYWKKHETVSGCSTLEFETHVVCSHKGEYWIDTDKLIAKHGVAGMILLRKRI